VFVFLLAGCVGPDERPPEPRSLEHARTALLAADLAALRTALGHDLLLERAGASRNLPDDAWLLATGASLREFDLPRARRATDSADRAALAEALGFGLQPMQADILASGSRLTAWRTANNRHFREVEPPLALLDRWPLNLENQPPFALRLHAKLDGRTVALGLSGAKGSPYDLWAREAAFTPALPEFPGAGAASPRAAFVARHGEVAQAWLLPEADVDGALKAELSWLEGEAAKRATLWRRPDGRWFTR
jgi:hypothetical protein